MRIALALFVVSLGWAVNPLRAEEPTHARDAAIPEPAFPAELRDNLVDALRSSTQFSNPHLDTRAKVPATQSLVWSGAAVGGETSISVFSLKLEPEHEAARSGVGPSEVEFVVEKDAVRVRPINPLQREYLGGLRFSRSASFVRRIAVRLEGNRELALFAPAMGEGDQGIGLAFCLTAIATKEFVGSNKAVSLIEYPSNEPFVISSSRFDARATIEGRSRSGILPARARAAVTHTANITPGVEETDETLSQDPAVRVTYSPRTPVEFVPAANPARVSAGIRAEVGLSTPAGHLQTQTIESEVWAERLTTPLTTSGGGLDMIPMEMLPKDSPAVGPVYGSCFVVGGRHSRSSAYAEPTPESKAASTGE